MLRRKPAAKKRGARRLLTATVDLAAGVGLIGPGHDTAAIDSTGMETRHVSVHYARASWRHQGHYKHGFPKLSALCDVRSHLILAAVVDRGPRPDLVEFPAALSQALSRHRFDTLLGDAGYESEKSHVLCRERHGVHSIFPTTHRGRRRRDGQPQAVNGTYRKQLQRRFPKKTYRQRWQIEAAFSMLKRNLGSALRSRRPFALNREVLLRVITHNLMILKHLLACFQRSMSVTVFPWSSETSTSQRLEKASTSDLRPAACCR